MILRTMDQCLVIQLFQVGILLDKCLRFLKVGVMRQKTDIHIRDLYILDDFIHHVMNKFIQ